MFGRMGQRIHAMGTWALRFMGCLPEAKMHTGPLTVRFISWIPEVVDILT